MTDFDATDRTARGAIATVLRRPLDGVDAADISRERLEGWDSLKHVEILLAVEEACGVQFSEDEFAELASLAGIVAAVQAHHAA